MMTFLALFGIAVALQTADTLPEIVRGARAARMDTLLTRASVYGFSGQVLVVERDTVVLHKAYGWADRGRGTPMRVDTRIGIASSSKQFAAAAVQRLASAGKLRLQTDGAVEIRGPLAEAILTADEGVLRAIGREELELSLG
jgi:CubicO group peptidase (beta-lactamase class C family)